MDFYFKYFGLDWIAMSASLFAVFLIGNKNRLGFLSYILANALWIYLGVFKMESIGISIGNIFFLMMNLRGFIKWKKELAKESDENGNNRDKNYKVA
jgi:hypothetical protein